MSSITQLKERKYSPRHMALLEARAYKMQQDRDSTRSEKLLIILSACLLGIAFDYFFNEQRFGISVLLYGLMLLGAAHFAFKGIRQAFLSLFLLAASLLLCASYGLFNNETLRVLNGLAIPLALTAYFLSARYGAWKNLNLSSVGVVFNKLIPDSIENAPKLIVFSVRELKAKPEAEASKTRSQILWGLMMAAPVLILVLMLLTSSDAVFSRLLLDRFTFLKDLRIDQFISHAVLTAIPALYFFGYLWSLKYERAAEDTPSPIPKNLEPVSALTVLSVLCAVYLLFTLVQFTYLYSTSASLPAGLTYAGYARRGFFELLAAAVVNIAVILALAVKAKDSSLRLCRALKTGNSVLTVFTLNLLVSAFYRMHLYETAYGFTELRLFVQFFMVFLAVSLAALLVWIWKQEFPLLKTVLIAAVTVYLALNFVNVDRLIAHNNLERYRQTQQLDTYHLSQLSVDAWPEIAAAGLPPGISKRLADDFRMNQYPSVEDHDHWFEYNYHQALFLEMQPR